MPASLFANIPNQEKNGMSGVKILQEGAGK